MKQRNKFFLPLFISLVFMTTSDANDKYKEGADFAKSVQGQGTNPLNSFNAPDTFPGFTATPPETGYYGGETSMSNADILNAGNNALNTSEVGKIAQESLLNRPSDKISLDAPFIDNGFQIQDKADIITGGSNEFCEPVNVNKTEINSYRCDRAPTVEISCTRAALITGNYTNSTGLQTESFLFSNSSYTISGGNYYITLTPTLTGSIASATYSKPAGMFPFVNVPYTLLGVTLYLTDAQSYSNVPFYPLDLDIQAGRSFTAIHPTSLGSVTLGKPSLITINLTVNVTTQVFNPYIEWTESCPFNKADEVLLTSQCIEEGGDRTITVEGKDYPVYSDCWKYKDTYFSQEADNGTCGKYMSDSACTLSSQKCLTSVGNICTEEQVYFSCETKISGEAQLCAGELVCNDGACDLLNNDKSNSFGNAVSGLAALAAAGEDVAALNGINVTAFTGAPRSCRKAAAGFSNCCKDSGWGASIGLAHCGSEENALGQAKERLLTVYIGEYCSNKVLGVCLQKKKSYCQFDSKLAQIIQEQGRGWQLGINFGDAENPNCRGITVDELQSILFDQVDFSNFYSDLTDGTTIPVDADIISRVKEQVAASMQQQSTRGK
jgi:conjugal transfer mating pair stabilization protein TraN